MRHEVKIAEIAKAGILRRKVDYLGVFIVILVTTPDLERKYVSIAKRSILDALTLCMQPKRPTIRQLESILEIL